MPLLTRGENSSVRGRCTTSPPLRWEVITAVATNVRPPAPGGQPQVTVGPSIIAPATCCPRGVQ